MGDPSGIGPAVIRKSLSRLKGLADFTIIGDRWVYDKAGRKPYPGRYNFIDLNNVPRKNFKFGRIRAEYGRASVEYVDLAVRLLTEGSADCLVTSPVCKEAINSGGLPGFSGQTEYLARKAGVRDFLMILLNKKMRFSLVTRHIPIKEVSRKLTADMIYRTVILSHRYMKELFLIKRPRIAVCGLNPHASDNGILGKEERTVIAPALKLASGSIKGIEGPLPADSAALKAAQGLYDCVVAVYHDQALIPLKMSGAYTGVNITGGLPYIRTSPLHGTAFDIAADSSRVKPDSFIEAVRLAVKCTLNRRKD